MHKKTIRVLGIVVVLLAGLAGTARADVLGALFPDAAKMGPPEWLKPGTRLTWYVADSIQYASPQKKGAAGHGYLELYAVAVEAKQVVFEIRQYFLEQAGGEGPARLVAVGGLVVDTPGVQHRYWLHPDALANALENPPADTQVTKAEVERDGEKREVVLVRYASGNSEFSWTFDAKTGIALNRAEAHIDQMEQRKSGDLAEFRGLAELDLPWKAQRNPSWIGDVSEIHYRGARQDQSAPGVSMPVASRFRKKTVGKGYALFESSSGYGVSQAQAEAALDGPQAGKKLFVSGGAAPSGLWIDPAKLAGLEAGDRVMESDVTGIAVTVLYVGPDQGRNVCVLRWENRLCQIDYVYDLESGGLLRNVWRTPTTSIDYVLLGTR